MSTNTYEPLENMISAGINSDFPEAPPTEAEFNEKADSLRMALQGVNANNLRDIGIYPA